MTILVQHPGLADAFAQLVAKNDTPICEESAGD